MGQGNKGWPHKVLRFSFEAYSQLFELTFDILAFDNLNKKIGIFIGLAVFGEDPERELRSSVPVRVAYITNIT